MSKKLFNNIKNIPIHFKILLIILAVFLIGLTVFQISILGNNILRPFKSFSIVEMTSCYDLPEKEFEDCFNSNKFLVNSPNDCEDNLGYTDINFICESLVYDDISLCDKGHGDMINYCKMMHAIKSNDVSLCNNIGYDDTTQQFCEQVVVDRKQRFSILEYAFIFE